ncbi:transfer complex protein TrsE [Mycoplasma mycoides subsp. capri]|uniref:Mbov_0397 family ICE element conjugal transfer ATPase n=1 Tax=Mycoplasma mycoides TaxID=2102 RepID=UPI002240051F|nr:transfer complex protein TrsE [Mycoplasma mycoides]QVK01563.1 transfer complex protein TrsE [Mycoplasma mycoides subsp. capri]
MTISPSVLIPYNNVYDQTTVTTYSEDSRSLEYIKAFEIFGNDISSYTLEEQEYRLTNFFNLFKFLRSNLSFVIMNKTINIKDYLNTLNKQIEDIKKDTLSENIKESKIQTIYETIDKLSSKEDEEILTKKYYVFYYNRNLEELNLDTIFLYEYLLKTGLNCNQLEFYETLTVLKDIIEPSTKDFIKENFKNINYQNINIGEVLEPNKLYFSLDSYNTNNNFVSNISVVDRYPLTPNRFWLLDLINTNSTVIIKITNTETKMFSKNLNKALEKIELQKTDIKTNKIVEQNAKQEEIQNLLNIIPLINSAKEKIKSITTYLITRTDSSHLRKSLKLIEKDININDFSLNNLLFRQINAFKSMFPRTDDELANDFKIETTASTLSESYPFVNQALIQNKGVFLGKNNLGELIIWNPFENLEPNSRFLNANTTIIAKSGSGKTASTIAIADRLISQNNTKMMFIDPDNDYLTLCDKYNGKHINLGSGFESRINPLQILYHLKDETKKDKSHLENESDVELANSNEVVISNHIAFLEHFFDIINPNYEINRYVLKMIKSLYTRWDFINKDLFNLKTTDWPTINDLINEFYDFKKDRKKEDKYVDEAMWNNALEFLKDEFTGFGKLSHLYNGHSTLNTQDSEVIVFDIKTLIESSNSKIIQAQIMLLTAFTQNEFELNSKLSNKNTILVIDEAHLLIDAQNPIALEFIKRTTKRVRKKRGGIWLITQNINDFSDPRILTQSRAILSNMQYKLFLQMDSEEIEKLAELLINDGGLTQSQKEFLRFCEKGQGLLIFGNSNSQKITIAPTELSSSSWIHKKINKE